MPRDDLADRRGPTFTLSGGGERLTIALQIPNTGKRRIGRLALREYLAQRRRRRLIVVDGGQSAELSGPDSPTGEPAAAPGTDTLDMEDR